MLGTWKSRKKLSWPRSPLTRMSWDFRKYTGVLIGSTLVALAVRLFIIEDYRISSDSMVPALLSGDLVVVAKPTFNLHLPFSNFEVVRIRKPMPGEIVAFVLPEEGMKTFVKRVVAVEGDTVEVKDGKVIVNSKPLEYLEKNGARWEVQPNGSTYQLDGDPAQSKQFGPVDVPKGHFFALGDNRNSSIDSRRWGPVPHSCLKGKVKLVWLSLDPKHSVRWARTLSSVH